MFNHRRKTIGKSVYYIVTLNGRYVVFEVYDKTVTGQSMYMHYYVDDAIQELTEIDREGYYTDNTRYFNF